MYVGPMKRLGVSSSSYIKPQDCLLMPGENYDGQLSILLLRFIDPFRLNSISPWLLLFRTRFYKLLNMTTAASASSLPQNTITAGSSTADLEKQHTQGHGSSEVDRGSNEISSEDLPLPKPADPNPADFPDGGLQAWTVVAGSCCCMFASMGWINCIGVFQDYYERNQLSTYSPSAVAWISSTETFMMFLGAPLFGKIFDNFGPRYMLLLGTICHVLGLMMTSLSSQYYQFFLAQSILSALGASALFYGCLNPIGTWFFQKRAFAFGIISAGSSLAGVILP